MLKEKLLKLQADAFVLWLNFHNYHWNVKGLQFIQLHEYTEKAYEDFAAMFDELAEFAIMKGEKAGVKAVDMANFASIKNLDPQNFTTSEVLKNIKNDYLDLKEKILVLNKVAENENDFTIQAWAQEKIAKYEKELWFIDNMLA